jgi:hypothetical protein
MGLIGSLIKGHVSRPNYTALNDTIGTACMESIAYKFDSVHRQLPGGT